MPRSRAEKAQALKDYIDALEKRLPQVHAEPMTSSSGIGDYWVRVEAPEQLLLDVVDVTSELSYDWRIERGVDILASVSTKEDEESARPSLNDL